ncbi:MAG: hypothetical protein LBP56_10320 [Odoribacteraceae bacterium]|jgi:hypothetical protein|nr:hypothetical protein [Odoribacteraceae bacterium]
MKQINKSRIACWLVAGSLLLACAKEKETPRDEATPARLSIDTRVEAGTTFRILTYTANAAATSTEQFKFRGTGTYYVKTFGDAELTPCLVDDDGTSPVEDIAGGLNGANGSFFIVFVSPAVRNDETALNTYETNPANLKGSFLVFPREAGGANGAFWATRPEVKPLGGYGINKMTNKLLDHRAKVSVKFYRYDNGKSGTEAVQSFEIDNLKLVGAGDESTGAVTLYPGTRQAIPAFPTEGIGMGLTEEEDPKPWVDEKKAWLFYSTTAPTLVTSAIYAPKATVAGVLGNTRSAYVQESDFLYLTCLITQGSQSQMAIRIPLTASPLLPNHELLPQCEYVFNIIVKSNYISATVDVYDHTHSGAWQTHLPDNGTGTIDTPSYTITLGDWSNASGDWQVNGEPIPPQQI